MKDTLKLALEVIQDYVDEYGPHDKDSGAQYTITAIKEALAQPEQEPVAWGVDWGKDGQQSCVSIVKRKPNGGIEVVAIEYNPTPSPPQRTWVGLDPEEIRKTNHHMVDGAYHYSFKQGAEWAEAKLKEKNDA